ncbi:hypothetical protein J6V86_02820 [bacterium]|nr:hypothetical protein [bacterium]
MIIISAKTTFIIHFVSFFHFSHSHAAITLNQVITNIMIAKKKAKAFNAESTTKNIHLVALVTHCIQSPSIVKADSLKSSTLPNIRLAPYINNHHTNIYTKLRNVFFTSSGFLLNNIDAQAHTINAIITPSVMSLITL